MSARMPKLTHLRVLALGDVHHRLGGRVHNFEQLERGRKARGGLARRCRGRPRAARVLTFMIVAPSLLMVVPLLSKISLSMPSGPWGAAASGALLGREAHRTEGLAMPRSHRTSVVRTASTTTLQALMLLISCALPCDVSVPSLSKIICG